VVPPLRERLEDLPVLVQYFLNRHAQRMKKKIESVPSEALEALARYHWPGNVRELEHLIERAVILSTGAVLEIPPIEPAPGHKSQGSPAGSLESVEREHIVRVLRETQGRIAGPGGAAERLGMNRSTLNSRMRKLGISRKAT
jgi:formate hydrogenlyase transcriptional activator